RSIRLGLAADHATEKEHGYGQPQFVSEETRTHVLPPLFRERRAPAPQSRHGGRAGRQGEATRLRLGPSPGRGQSAAHPDAAAQDRPMPCSIAVRESNNRGVRVSKVNTGHVGNRTVATSRAYLADRTFHLNRCTRTGE